MSQPLPIEERRAPRQALQARVSSAILDAAARVFAARGDEASMNDVAEAAGIARATLYRYFPNRAALIDRLAELAVDAAAERLRDSRVNEVRPIEGMTRAVRALIEVGDLFIVLGRERVRPDPEAFDRGVMGPLRAVIERGRAEGALRDDISSQWATEALVALVVSVVAARPALGQEDAVAAALAIFLDGARARPVAQE